MNGGRMSNRYYAVDVAAASAGVPPSTVRRWISEGKLTSLMHHGRRYVTLQATTEARDAPRKAHMLRKLTG